MRTKIVKSPASRPALRVQARVDDQTDGAAHFCCRCVQSGRLLDVEPQSLAERGGVKPPAFCERGLGAEAAESRKLCPFLLKGNLKMLARQTSLQKAGCRQPRPRPPARIHQESVDAPRAAALIVQRSGRHGERLR